MTLNFDWASGICATAILQSLSADDMKASEWHEMSAFRCIIPFFTLQWAILPILEVRAAVRAACKPLKPSTFQGCSINSLHTPTGNLFSRSARLSVLRGQLLTPISWPATMLRWELQYLEHALVNITTMAISYSLGKLLL